MIRIASFAAAALITAALAAPAQASFEIGNGLDGMNGISVNGLDTTNGLNLNGLNSSNGLTATNGPAAPTPVTLHGITLPGGATLSMTAR